MDVIQELVYLLKSRIYEADEIIVKKGDTSAHMFFLKLGIVKVEIPLKKDKITFDSLNSGSCFCIYSAFHEERK